MLNDEINELEGMIATLELENKLMRERNERLEKEVEQLHHILTERIKNEAT
jgi:hypothetical protein